LPYLEENWTGDEDIKTGIPVMIRELHIKNLALIEELSLEFEKGFSVFTGETGAGKSILVGAIGLLLVSGHPQR
jgi:AAA15 family ATPase/GTPase